MRPAYSQKLREGVTPVARQLPRQFAGFWIRFVAVLIDGIILAVVGWIVQFAFLGAVLRPGRIMNSQDVNAETVGAAMGLVGLVFIVDIAIACGYEAFFLGRFGATPGKMALSLKVVRPSGAPISYARGAGRYFAKQLNLMTLMIGYIIAGFDSEKRGLHDMICDTRVIKTGV